MTRSYRALGSSTACIDCSAHLLNPDWESEKTQKVIANLAEIIPQLVEQLKRQPWWGQYFSIVCRPTVYEDLERAVEGAFREFPATPPPSKKICERIAALAHMNKEVEKCMLVAINQRLNASEDVFVWEDLYNQVAYMR